MTFRRTFDHHRRRRFICGLVCNSHRRTSRKPFLFLAVSSVQYILYYVCAYSDIIITYYHTSAVDRREIVIGNRFVLPAPQPPRDYIIISY